MFEISRNGSSFKRISPLRSFVRTRRKKCAALVYLPPMLAFFSAILVYRGHNLIASNASIDPAKQQLPVLDKQAASSPYAYAFLVGGVDEQQPGYRGFLYNILVASRSLREFGSTADIVALFQFVAGSPLDELPAEEVRLLRALDVRIEYLPRPDGGVTFCDLTLEKFRVLALTRYRRVLFLDSDVLPLNNLDYLFHMSDGPGAVLKENLVVATRGEPSNAGFFMLRPGRREWELLQNIIRQQRHESRDLPPHKFDRKNGWGHSFLRSGDKWVGTKFTGQLWDYWGADCDQGLLYYWVRYVKKEVSLVIGDKIQNWSTDAEGRGVMEAELQQPLQHLPERYGTQHSQRQIIGPYNVADSRPYTDYAHFTGGKKPWMVDVPPGDCLGTNPNAGWSPGIISPIDKWFHTFCSINKNLGMGIDMTHWATVRKQIGDAPLSLGSVPQLDDKSNRVDGIHKETTQQDQEKEATQTGAAVPISTETKKSPNI